MDRHLFLVCKSGEAWCLEQDGVLLQSHATKSKAMLNARLMAKDAVMRGCAASVVLMGEREIRAEWNYAPLRTQAEPLGA